jgi:uncharacterized protein
MRFYDRESELAVLREMRKQSEQGARMIVITGRRRVGKTRVVREAFGDAFGKAFGEVSGELPGASAGGNDLVYFFVARKNEALLCEEFSRIIQDCLGVRIIGSLTSFAQIFEYLLEISTQRSFTLAIDEFQEFLTVNPAVYSVMQHLWDTYKTRAKLNLVLCGSIYSLMQRLFENSKEPLFGRADRKIAMKPLGVPVLRRILEDHHPRYSPKDLLVFFLLTGGIAKYVELLVDQAALTVDTMLDAVLAEHSFFLYEGRDVLIDEFGRDHATYFSILSLLAGSRTGRSEMESALGRNIGGHLDRLEKDYNIIHKVRPLFAKTGSRFLKYAMDDNFLNFWFRFIFKNLSAVEMGNPGYVRRVVERDLNTYSGPFLEKYFIRLLEQSGRFNRIGPSWERGNANEIDIVAVNDLERKLLFAEVKLNKANINLTRLRAKAKNILAAHPGYEAQFQGLSLDDMRGDMSRVQKIVLHPTEDRWQKTESSKNNAL